MTNILIFLWSLLSLVCLYLCLCLCDVCPAVGHHLLTWLRGHANLKLIRLLIYSVLVMCFGWTKILHRASLFALPADFNTGYWLLALISRLLISPRLGFAGYTVWISVQLHMLYSLLCFKRMDKQYFTSCCFSIRDQGFVTCILRSRFKAQQMSGCESISKYIPCLFVNAKWKTTSFSTP